MKIPLMSSRDSLRCDVLAGCAAILLAVTGSAAESGIFSWEPSLTPVADPGGTDRQLFRSILKEPHIDSESFWIRDQRWTAGLDRNRATSSSIPLLAFSREVPDIRLTDMGRPILPLSLTALALGGGVLVLQRKLHPSPATG